MEERTVFQPSAPGSVRPGVRLNGIYEIESLIAQGGMGEVYKGFNILTRDPVAIKMILPDLARNPDAFALFRREASTLHNLQHEAIVRYYVFSVDPALDRAYLAMEFVDGVSLAKKLAEGPLSIDDARVLQRRVASALEAAHQLGVIHRDMSSDNVILPGGDVRRAKVIDFGIAKSVRPGEGTIIGDGFAGKYKYVSPEQLGLAGGVVGPKSDIYSFGLVLAEALRGQPLDMGGSQAEVIDKRRVVPDLSSIPAPMRPLIQAMLQPKPEDRPASMAAVAAWVPEAPAGRESSKTLKPAPARRSGSGGAIAAILGILILLAGIGAAAYVLRDDLTAWLAASGLLPKPAPTNTPTEAPTPTPTPTPSGPPPLPTPTESGPPPLPTPTESNPPPLPTPTQTAAPPQPSPTPTQAQPSPAPTPAPSPTPTRHVPTQSELEDQLPPKPEVASVVLPKAAVGKAYRASLPGFADPGGKGLKLHVEPAPPAGLSFRDMGGGKSELTGSPLETGTSEFSLVAQNHNGRTGQILATIVIEGGETPTPVATPTLAPTRPAPSPTPTPAPAQPSPTPSAVLTPPPTPEPAQTGASEPVGPVAKAAAFVAAFDGGPCFLMRSQGDPERLQYQGVGVDAAPFQRFDQEFTKAVGVDAKIGLRLIAPQQCPALALLKASPDRPDAPRIDAANLDIGPGKPLAGEVANIGGLELVLLIATNDGATVKIDAARTAGGDKANFSVPLTPDAKSVKTLQMLLAVVSPRPLKTLETFRAGSTAEIMPKLNAEIAAEGGYVAAEFFRVGN